MEENDAKGKATRVWVSAVRVSDLDRSLRFYRDLLGFPVRLEARRFGWMEVGPEEPLGKIGLALVPNGLPQPDAPVRTGIILEVDDMDAFAARLRAAGVRFTHEPTRQPWGGLQANFMDPDANEIEAVHDPSHYSIQDPGISAP